MPVHATRNSTRNSRLPEQAGPRAKSARPASFTDQRTAPASFSTGPGTHLSQLKAYQAMADKNAQTRDLPKLTAPVIPAVQHPVQVPALRAAPVQRQINPRIVIDHTKPSWGIDEKFRNRLLAKVKNYNEKENRKDHSKDNVHRNLKILDELEHWLYQWFEEHKTETDNANRAGLFDLLDAIQENHQFWVSKNVEQGHEMWTKDKVTDPQEKILINSVWDHIANGTGAFHILNTISSTRKHEPLPTKLAQKVKNEILSNLARLFSRPKGRELLKALDGDNADPNDITFVLAPLYKLLGTYEEPYVGAKAKPLDMSGSQLQVSRGKKGKKTLRRGTGSGTGVEVSLGVKDGDMVDFDKHDNQILSPTFVGLGHELVHSAHFKRGTYIGPKPRVGEHANVPGHYNNDVEEFVTIADKDERDQAKHIKATVNLERADGKGNLDHSFKLSKFDSLNRGIPTEAEIREEHGLSIRHGHTTMANPARYRGAQKTDKPGKFITTGKDLLTPHLDTLDPQPQQQPAPQQQVVHGQQQVAANKSIVSFLKKHGFTSVVLGSMVLVTLLWKLGYFSTEKQTS